MYRAWSEVATIFRREGVGEGNGILLGDDIIFKLFLVLFNKSMRNGYVYPSLCAILMRNIFNYVHSRGNCSSSSVSGPAKEWRKIGFQPYLTLRCEEGCGSSSASRPCIIHERRTRHLTVVHLPCEMWQDEWVWVALWSNFCNITKRNT